MLSNETVIRTPLGDRTISALQPVDQVFDSHNRVKTVSVGASEPLVNLHRVVIRPFHPAHNGLQENEAVSSFIVDSAHQLHLWAPKYVKAITMRDKKHPEFFAIVEWRTRCVGYTSLEECARYQESSRAVALNRAGSYLRQQLVRRATIYLWDYQSRAKMSQDHSFNPAAWIEHKGRSRLPQHRRLGCASYLRHKLTMLARLCTLPEECAMLANNPVNLVHTCIDRWIPLSVSVRSVMSRQSRDDMTTDLILVLRWQTGEHRARG